MISTWIKCSDRMPPEPKELYENKIYLTYIKSKDCSIMYLLEFREGKFFDWDGIYYEPHYWMSIPDAPIEPFGNSE